MFAVILFIFVMGLVWGSFLNVVIFRTAKGKSPIKGRSICPKCKHQLRWFHNIPLLSYVLLKGKCAYCHKNISWRYPLIEGITGILFVWWFVVGFNFFRLMGYPWGFVQPLFWLVVSMLALSIFMTDLLYMVIPFSLNFLLFSVALFYRVFLTGIGIMRLEDFLSALLSGLGLGLFFWLLSLIVKRWKKVDGMGMGDVYLSPSIGLILGWPKILVGVFSSFVIGAVIGLILIMLKKKKMSSYIPFGPFLIIGLAIGLLFGEKLIRFYLGWY